MAWRCCKNFLIACLLAAGSLAQGAAAAEIRFEEMAAKAGIDFRHQRAKFDSKVQKIMPWLTAGGAAVAVGDFDNDGLDDIYVTTSRMGAPNKLYRNLGDWKFEDVAPQVGLADVNGPTTGTSSFALWFDYDNDGWRDLLVVRMGRLSLFKNVEGKRFEEVTVPAGLDRLINSTSAAAFDYNHDGYLDLLICGYFPEKDFNHLPDSKVLFDSWETAKNGGRTYLFRNNGDGTFTDATEEAGLKDNGWTMAIGIGDLDDDGWQDIYLARDFGADKMYRNLGNGKFQDVSEQAIGVDTKKGMNAEMGDYNNDGRLDIFVTNMTEPYLHECNMLWQNNGNFHFTDVADETGVCDTGWGWGGKFLDVDNDGQLDLYVVNGFISAGKQDYMKVLLDFIFREDVDLRDAQDWPDMTGYSMAGYEKHVLFHQEGGVFKNIASSANLDDNLDARGVAIADFDHDGRMDIVVSTVDGPIRLYRNVSTAIGNWIGFNLHDRKGKPEPIGARVYVATGLDRQMREISPANGFEAQSTLAVHFGIGKSEKAEVVTVVWPDGERKEYRNLPGGKYYDVTRDGIVEAAPAQPNSPAPQKSDAKETPTRGELGEPNGKALAAGPAKPQSGPRLAFKEAATMSGVVARHHPPIFDQKLNHIMAMVSAGAAGGAIGDVNGDGLDDIFISDSRAGRPNHLFINLGNRQFEDRAVVAGVANYNDESNICTGGIFFDYDGDGLEDLLILRFGSQVLLHNLGNGRFEDVSEKSGLARIKGNFLSAIAFDADRDGYLDLYLGAYFPDVDLFHLKDDRVLHDSWEAARNGGRKVFLHNNGDGTFTDATANYGLEDTGWTMALGYGDIDNDGWQDVYVANDYGPDKLFHNERGHFRDISASAIGVDTKKGMNAEFGDFDNDGFPDIFVTNVTEPFLHECNMLWRNNGDLTFTDLAQEMGVCDGGWGWGGKFADVDNDGYLDIYQVNGFFSGEKTTDYLTVLLPALWNNNGEDPSSAAKWPPIDGMSMVNKETHRLFLNQGGLGFRRYDETALSNDTDGRGVFTSDLDNDGRIDFVVTNNDGPVQVFYNETLSTNNWVEFSLRGKAPNTDAAGAKVTIETGNGRQYREVNIGNGFAGGSSTRLHFGLGKAETISAATVRWPDGHEQALGPIEINRIVRVDEQVMTTASHDAR
jgi:hypothetical protein